MVPGGTAWERGLRASDPRIRRRDRTGVGLALVLALAALKLTVHLMLAGRYGYFRDETVLPRRRAAPRLGYVIMRR